MNHNLRQMIAFAVLLLGGFNQHPKDPAYDLPGVYHSPVSKEQRIKAIGKLESLLSAAEAKDADAKRALKVLDRAMIVEPLGEDSSGSDLVRVLVVAKLKSKYVFGVIAVFASDAKACRNLRDFVNHKPTPYVGFDPDGSSLLVRVDAGDLEKNLPKIAKQIVEFGPP